MNKIVAKIPNYVQSVIAATKPKYQTFMHYARVELVPPTPAEVGEATRAVSAIIQSARTGKWRQLTVRDSWLNTLVTVEVICWFFVGECIGKRSLIGYQV